MTNAHLFEIAKQHSNIFLFEIAGKWLTYFNESEEVIVIYGLLKY